MSSVVEQRRHARSPVNTPASFSVKGRAERTIGFAKDISIGGMFIETPAPAAFGAHVIIHVELPGASDLIALPGVVRWVRDGGMGIQFGSLGALETHIITEFGRTHADAVRAPGG